MYTANIQSQFFLFPTLARTTFSSISTGALRSFHKPYVISCSIRNDTCGESHLMGAYSQI